MDLMAQLAAEKKAAQDIIAKGMENITPDEQKQLKEHYEQAKALNERVTLFKEASAGLDMLGSSDTRKEGARVNVKSLGDLYAAELNESGMSAKEGAKHGFATSDFKAASDTQSTGGSSGAYAPMLVQVDQNGVWPYERPLVVADLFSTGTMTGNSIKYPVYGALEGGAGMVAEGGQKPQLHLPDPTWELDALHEIAAWWKVTDDMAEDLPYIVSEINMHAQYNLKLQEEIQLLTGDGAGQNVKGLLNRGVQEIDQDTDTDMDRIYKAKMKVTEATGFTADAMVVNPSDYAALRLSKDANGQYYSGGPFTGAYGNVGAANVSMLWDITVVITEAMTKGTVLVGAFKVGGTVYRKGGLRVESTNSHDTDFTNDLITYRVRERVALQVKYPKAFVKVTLGKAGK